MTVATSNNNSASTASSGRVLRPRPSAQATSPTPTTATPTTRPRRGGGTAQGAASSTTGTVAAVAARTTTGGAPASNVHPTVTQPILAFVAPPKVVDVSHEGLTAWWGHRQEYEEISRAKCRSSGEEESTVMVSIRNSWEEALLDTMCEGIWNIDKATLTDEFLRNWIQTTIQSFKNKILPNVKELFERELKMDESMNDVQAQVVKYLHLCNTIIRTNGLVGLFTGEAGAEKKCKVLINSLPPRLKQRVNNEIDYNDNGKDVKKSVPSLVALITAQALEQGKIDMAFKNAGRKRGASDRPSGDERPGQQKKQKHAQDSPARANGKQKRRAKKDSTLPDGKPSSGGDKKKDGPHGGCFNCGGAHYASTCTAMKADSSDNGGVASNPPGGYRGKGRQRPASEN